MDISSSKVAKAISTSILARSHMAVIDEGFVIEAREEGEIIITLVAAQANPHKLIALISSLQIVFC